MKLSVSSTLNKSEAIVLPLFEGQTTIAVDYLTAEEVATIAALIETKKISGKAKETYYLPTPTGSFQGIILMGFGIKEDCTNNVVRQNTANVAKIIASNKITSITFAADLTVCPQCPAAFAEALVLTNYKHEQFKSKASEDTVLEATSIFATNNTDDVATEVSLAEIRANGANFARELGDSPGNKMTPTILAERAVALANETDLTAKVLDEAAMEELGMGSLLSVSQGSEEEAKMIFLEHTHPEATKTIAIVGKGLTFDAGGISLKPGAGMWDMIYDMCGGTAVLGAMHAISRIKPKINVIGVVPSSENMPDGRATKPGDVFTAYNGKTIEVLNTDAEGRLILIDALSYTAEQYKPDRMVNLATLTGAVIVALGHNLAAVMSESDELVADLQQAGDETHERLWRLPLKDEYKEFLKGKSADYANISTPGAGAGTVTAGCFLSEFVGDTEWAHLDIAGTAWKMAGADYINPKYASGFGARLLTKWLCNEAN